MPVRLGPVLLLLAFPLPAAAEGEASARFSCREIVSEDVLVDTTPGGELRLASGATIRLPDLRLPSGGQAAAEAASWLLSLRDSRVRVREVAPPDRWGRAAAHLELTGGSAAIDIGELLVSEGLAVVDSGQRDMLCRPELLAAETQARQRRLGMWRDSAWPIAASALDELDRAAGSFAIVQGRIVSVGERRERTYLNFGRDWSRDFTVTIPRRSWAELKARGVTAETLRGQVVRVRGTLEKRRAPTLDLVVPDMLEVIRTAPTRPGGG